MIASIRGKIISVKDSLIIETSGLGYRVSVPTSILDTVRVGDEIQLFTHQYIREDAVELHGFRLMVELELFEKLISVSGVGPKAGLALLSQFSVEALQQSIILGDTSLLTKVSGIGKKTAERLILELKGSLAVIDDTTIGSGQSSVMGEAVSALEQLGYSGQEALVVMQQVDRTLPIEAQIKQALIQLGK